MLRNSIKDEGYWVVLLLLTAAPWVLLEKTLTEDTLTTVSCVLALAGVALRLTVLRRWHLYNLAWTLDGEQLTLGDRVIPLSDIDSVGLKKGFLTKGSLYLVIRGRQTVRLAALIRGANQARSVQSIRELGWALKQTTDRLDGTEG